LFCTFSFSIAEKVSIAKLLKKVFQEKGFTLVLKEVVSFSLSRDCIWAGEVVLLSVYKDSKLVEDNTMVFHENQEENKLWFCKYLPDNKKI
jgi:hypothetical protein